MTEEAVVEVAQNGAKQKTLANYSVQELKAMVYDQMVNAEQSRNNIQVLNAELAKRK